MLIHENDYFKFWHYLNMPINIFLLIPIIMSIISVDKIRSKHLSYIGIHSLPIYLYHAVPVLLAKYYLVETDVICYYCIMTIIFVVFSLSVNFAINYERKV